jgi:hypothetical protein
MDFLNIVIMAGEGAASVISVENGGENATVAEDVNNCDVKFWGSRSGLGVKKAGYSGFGRQAIP